MTPERERPYRVQNSEVLYSDEPIVTAAQSDIRHLIRLSADNPRKRVRLCAHKDPQRLLHEMLIIHERSAYVRPHQHPGKSESMHVISGEVDIVVFDSQGGVSEVIEMGDYASGKIFYYRMEAPLFHMLIIRSDVLVFHETTDGPFKAGASEFPDWAPDGADAALAIAYVADLDRILKTKSKSL